MTTQSTQRDSALPMRRTYVRVWLALVALLALNIAAARLRLLADFSVVASLIIATAKALLVLAFFMHLRYEGRLLRWALAAALGALTVLIILTFSDTWYR